MTTQNVIEARIKAKANERDRIGMFGPAALIVGSVPVFLLSPYGLIGVIITAVVLGTGIVWGISRQKQKDKINDEIEVLMAELEVV